VASSAGISFRHDNAASREKYLIETMGSGCGWIDYDQNGLLDLYLANGSATPVYHPKHPLRSVLYRNNGDRTFTDVIANYVDWSPERNFHCGEHGPGMRSYLHPDDYNGEPATLFRNNGNGTFTDVSRSSGVGLKPGNGLGVVTFDYDQDGWQDIFIANDSMPNFLFHNERNGTFREVAYAAGVAVSMDGAPEAGMGADAGDVTGNGRPDLVITHLDSQLARMYENLGGGEFDDATLRCGIGYAAYHMSEFGVRFMDYDNDGMLDLFMACGRVLDNIHRYNPSVHYREPKLMFRNTGHGNFENVSDLLGPDFRLPRASRGAAVADFDNDGDLDILINNNGEAPQLLRNDGGTPIIGWRSFWWERDQTGTRSVPASR
jgi:enediyne biosynthesis protein E4